MGDKYRDAYKFFFIFICLLATATGFSLKKKGAEPIEQIAISYKDAVNQIQPLLYASGEEILARSLIRFPDAITEKILENLVFTEDSPFEAQEKVRLLAALIYYYDRQGRAEYGIKVAMKYHDLFEHSSLLYIAEHSGYETIVPVIVEALKRGQSQHDTLLANGLIKNGVQAALENDDLVIAKKLYKQGVFLQPNDFDDLLFFAVEGKKDPRFVDFFVEHGASINRIKEGKTVLLIAIEKRSIAHVAALLKAGANPQLIASPHVGTPLQVAFENGLVDIERLLRKYGARY